MPACFMGFYGDESTYAKSPYAKGVTEKCSFLLPQGSHRVSQGIYYKNTFFKNQGAF